MTTRHTISHADELYAGNAYKAGYSPDGRRGIKMTHLYAHEFLSTAGVPALGKDIDGIFSSYANTSLLSPSQAAIGVGGNLIGLATGALTSAGATIIEFDVPRNVIFQVSGGNATVAILQLRGLNQYGEAMVETIQGATQTVGVSGKKCFKSIHHISLVGATKAYATQILANTTILRLGTGDRLGLPFNLADAGKLISFSIDGYAMQPTGATGSSIYTVHIGASAATTITSVKGTPDVRGCIKPVSPVPNGTLRFTALMVVDHTTERKAFGPPDVTACTAAY